MIIKKLNGMFHKHGRVLFIIFTLVIIVSFMGFLTPGQFGCNGSYSSEDTVGVIYGKKVSRDDLLNFYNKHVYMFERKADWKDIFALYCLDVRAEQLGIHVSDADVAKKIRQSCLDKDGKYDEKIYQRLMKILNERGISEECYVETTRLELKIQKLGEYIVSQVVVTPSEVDRCYKEVNTKMHFKVASFKPADFVPNKAALEDFFKKNKDQYRCVKVAVFPLGKDPKAAEKQLYEFLREVKQNEANFVQVAKKRNVKILPEQWMTMTPENITDIAQFQLAAAIFAADAKKPVTKVIRSVDNNLYVGCLVGKSDKDEFTAIKARLEKRWRLEEARKKAERESKRLNDIADRALREKAFLELKKAKATIADKVEKGGGALRDGETFAVDGSVYLLQKREIPTAAMPEKERPAYREKCRNRKAAMLWDAFREELSANCKFLLNQEGRR